jgi:hypothetical protein
MKTMVDNIATGKVMNIVGTVILGIILLIVLIGYVYIDIRHLYRERERRWWIGLLAFILPMTGLLAGIGILVIWNQLIRSLFWLLLIFAGVLSIILWQSIVSPYEMADWWTKFGIWWKQRNKKL